MRRSEERELVVCTDCGVEVSVRADYAFTFGSSGVLCVRCAIRRGGRYDASQDHWVEEPDFGDLAPEFD